MADVTGVIRCGEKFFMEPPVREKSTGKTDLSLSFISWSVKALYFVLKLLCFCRKEIREQLKRQMEEKSAELKLQRLSSAKESQYLREVDHLAQLRDREEKIQHSKAMTAYRDENKRVRSFTHHAFSINAFWALKWPENASWTMLSGSHKENVCGLFPLVLLFVCVFFFMCIANGTELEGQSANTFPGGPEGARAAAP